MADVDISNGVLTINFKELSVKGENDLARLLQNLSPHLAQTLLEAKQKQTTTKKDWAVSGTVSTSSGGTTASATGTVSGKDVPRDWNVGVSGSTNVGGATVTGGVGVGSQGVSGSVGVSAHF